MKPSTAESLLNLAVTLDLAPAATLHKTFAEFHGQELSVEEFGQTLVRRELITGFQLERLLRGDQSGYYFGIAKVLYQIGAGSFARVYRAIHRDNGSVLAVKVLRNRFANDPEKCLAFRHEGEMGLLLRHANIVAIEDVGQEHGASYLTMEFIEGQTLRELVKIRGAVDVPRALDLVHQMVSGLEYAHRRGVTHRDLKASNVIVSATGQAKLVDFGLAGVDETGDKSLGRVEKPRTVDYAALEKTTGVRDDAIRSDIYFLGTVAYLALAGEAPLTESRDRKVRADPRRFTEVVPLRVRAPDLPRDVIEIVTRMMQLDPVERWQTATDVRRALEAAMNRRAGGNADASAPAADHAAAKGGEGGPAATCKGSLMLVESDETAQQAMRAYFSKLGYRVLVTENPQRALARFSNQPLPADFLVLSTRTLGEAAVEAFNQLSADPSYADVPAILLVGEKQAAMAGRARADDRRRIVPMPVHSGELGVTLVAITTRSR